MDNKKSIPIGNDAIGVAEQRNLIELGRGLNRALNQEEYMQIVFIYKNVIDRLFKTASDLGIKIEGE